MDGTIEIATGAWQAYLNEAVGPLHKLTWQTGSLFLIILLAAALLAYWIARATWVFSKPALVGVKVRGGPHTYVDFLRLNSAAFKKFHRRDPQIANSSEIVKKDLAADSNKFYVVTVVESGKRIPIFTKEMHLQFAGKKYSVPDGMVQFDSESLNAIRLGNTADDDDENGAEIAGQYDVYIRPVRWYDLRHWLTHPNREIRIVLWVTIITTLLPILIDILFGK